MNNKQYFPHDYNAHHDPKIIKLMQVHGLEGVGIYWCIVERLYQEGGTLSMDYIDAIAFELHVQSTCIASVLQDFNLFKNDGHIFWSDSIIKRLEKRKSVKENRQKAANARWNNANAMQEQSKCNANTEQVQCKNFDSNMKDKKDTIFSKEKGETSVSPTGFDAEKIKELYHSTCTSYSRLFKISEVRERKMKIRFEEMGCDYNTLEQVFKKMQESKFLRGDNARGWKATFDWLFENPRNWVKVLEGNYDNCEPTKSEPQQYKPNNNNKDCNSEWT